jgi:protein-disulfide isomerase
VQRALETLSFIIAAIAIAVLAAGCSPSGTPEAGQDVADVASVDTTDGTSSQQASNPDSQDESQAPDAGANAAQSPNESGSRSDDSASESEGDEAQTDESNQPNSDSEATPDPTLQAFYESFEIPRMGDADAPVSILEISDYMCPYCGLFARETAPEIQREYIDKGLVSLSFIDFPIPGHGWASLLSHEAAHCAGEQDAYWKMHYAIFNSQEALSKVDHADPQAPIAELQRIAESVGLDGKAMQACLESELYRPIVSQLFDTAQQRGVSATPTFIITSVGPDGEARSEVVEGYLPFEDFKPYIERALSHHEGTPVPDPTPIER